MDLKEQKKAICIKMVHVLIMLFYLWLAAQIPYTHDDWDWGGTNGIDMLLHATVNSRYAGNFFVVIMTRSEVLKVIIMGLGFFLFPLYAIVLALGNTEAIQSKRGLLLFLLSNSIILMMEREIWQQTYGWVSGYANFGISAFVIMGWMWEFEKSIEGKADGSVMRIIEGGLFALIGQLFLENLAIYLVLFAIYICVIQKKIYHKVNKKAIWMLVASIMGLFIMFSSNIYTTLWCEGEAIDGYRKLTIVGEDALIRVIRQGGYLILKTLGNNYCLTLSTLALLTYLIIRNKNSSKMPILYVVFNIVYIMYLILGNMTEIYQSERLIWAGLNIVSNCCFYVMVIMEIICLYKNEKRKLIKLITYWLSIALIIAPLVATSEKGARLYFSTNVVWLLFTLVLANDAVSVVRDKKISVWIVLAMTGVAIAFTVMVYSGIGKCKRERDGLMSMAIERHEKVVHLPCYPFLDHLWIPEPNEPKRMEDFKNFYDLEEDVVVKFLR